MTALCLCLQLSHALPVIPFLLRMFLNKFDVLISMVLLPCWFFTVLWIRFLIDIVSPLKSPREEKAWQTLIVMMMKMDLAWAMSCQPFSGSLERYCSSLAFVSEQSHPESCFDPTESF